LHRFRFALSKRKKTVPIGGNGFTASAGQSETYGSSAITRARLMATANWRWCFAQVPEARRGAILPRSVKYFRSFAASL
jgi:hypothetical protein